MASGTSRAPRTSRAPVVITIVGSIVLVAVLAIAGVVVAPQIIRAAATEVATTDTRITLTSTGATATVPVDEGWSYVVGPFDSATGQLRSPDGALTVDLTATSGTDAETAVRDVVGSAVTPFDSEPVGAARVVHARIVGEDAIAGAVVSGDALLVFVAHPSTGYEAEIAGLLSRIEVTP